MKKHIISLTERVSATFLFSFIGFVLATGTNNLDATALKAAAIAGGLSVAKYVYAVTAQYLKSTSASSGQSVAVVSVADLNSLLSAYGLGESNAKSGVASSPVAVDPVIPAPAPLA